MTTGPAGREQETDMQAADDHPLLRELRHARESGLILFTSGSTGETKAALPSFDRLLEKFRMRLPSFTLAARRWVGATGLGLSLLT